MKNARLLPTYRTKRVFPQSITIDASSNQNKKDARDAFPNRRALAPFFADVGVFDALDEESKRDVRASYFVAFERQFEETTARLFRLSSFRVSFVRFGFDRTVPWDDSSFVRLQSDDARFFFVASYETFLLFLCASLGFDVERICRDEVLWRDLTSNRGVSSTELERETSAFVSTRLSAFFPNADAGNKRNWRGDFFERPTRELLERRGDESCYWEERVLEIGAKRFPWRLCFPFSNFLGENASFPVEPDLTRTSRRFGESDRVEVAVEIGRGSVDAERWKTLKPGDVLATETSADALFTVLLDGEPTFKARPGVFRGVTSVQLKERVAE